MIIINVAIYCRLSKDDGTNQTSTSIENQKQSLTEYAIKNSWNIYKIYEDDGYSGTNFDRPGFNKLIDDIEQNKINIVITKDLSRLGRNYLETGYYTETFFPDNNVRFIAVNDNFDTNQENDFAPFKNIINEWYAKDISKKIRFSLNQKMKEPRVLGCSINLYGYILNDKKERIIDPIVAPTVQLIFNCYINGMKTNEIKQLLTSKEIVTPGYYAYIKYNWSSNKYSKYLNTNEKYKWNVDSISKIIRNIEYTGDLINKKYQNKSFKNKRRTKILDEDRHHFSDIFNPIVSKEIFYKANELMDKQLNSSVPTSEKKFLGLCYCANCGSILKYERRSKGNPFYFCRNKKCDNKKNINANKLQRAVYADLIDIKSYIDKVSDKIINFLKNDFKQVATKETNNNEIIEKINENIKQLQNKISKLVESNINDDIPYEVYDKLLKKYKVEKEQLERTLKTYVKEETKKPVQINYVELFYTFKAGLENIENGNLTQMFLTSIIKKIKIDKQDNDLKLSIDYKMNIKTIVKEYNLWKQLQQQSIVGSLKKIQEVNIQNQ